MSNSYAARVSLILLTIFFTSHASLKSQPQIFIRGLCQAVLANQIANHASSSFQDHKGGRSESKEVLTTKDYSFEVDVLGIQAIRLKLSIPALESNNSYSHLINECVCPPESLVFDKYDVIRGSSLVNVRAFPSTGKVIARIPEGALVIARSYASDYGMLEAGKGRWVHIYWIESGNLLRSGFVFSAYLSGNHSESSRLLSYKEPRKQTFPTIREFFYVDTKNTGLAIRSKPFISQSTLIERLDPGTELELIKRTKKFSFVHGRRAEWWYVKNHLLGVEGYVWSGYLTKKE